MLFAADSFGPMASEVEAAVATLGRTLLNVSAAMALGYVFRSTGQIGDDALKGVGAFIGLVGLPALLLRAVAGLDFYVVDLYVCAAVVAGKLLLILASALLAAATAPSSKPGVTALRAGVLALTTTNSDDLGLGLPVLSAIFPSELVGMAYVLNALQTMLFNPIIFVLLGVGAARRDAPPGAERAPTHLIVLAVLRGLGKNLVIVAVLLGLAYNGVVGALRGAALPWPVDNLCVLMGGAFGPAVLFMAGGATVGAFERLAALDSALVPTLTALLKSVLLPAFVTSATSWLGGTRDAANFAFTFASLPAAGSTFVFAAPSRPSPALVSLMSASLAMGKIVGFPLLFLSAAIYKTDDTDDLLALDSAIAAPLEWASIVLTGTLVASFCWHGPWRRPPLAGVRVIVVFTFGYALASAAPAVPAALGGPCARFIAVSFCRWAADASILVAAADRYAEARDRLGAALRRSAMLPLRAPLLAPADPADVGAIKPSVRPPSWAAERSAAAATWRWAAPVCAGVLMTLPWLALAPYPAHGAVDSEGGELRAQAHLRLWMPWVGVAPTWQAHVFSAAYALGAFFVLCCAATVMRLDAHASAAAGGGAKPTGPARRARGGEVHAFLVRFECLLFLQATRMALAAALCAALAADPLPTGAKALMLLVTSMLANATGPLLFLLFGLGERGVLAPLGRLAGLPGAAGPRKLLQSRVRHALAVEVMRDSVSAAAASEGYGPAHVPRGEIERAAAALAIQRGARRPAPPGPASDALTPPHRAPTPHARTGKARHVPAGTPP